MGSVALPRVHRGVESLVSVPERRRMKANGSLWTWESTATDH